MGILLALLALLDPPVMELRSPQPRSSANTSTMLGLSHLTGARLTQRNTNVAATNSGAITGLQDLNTAVKLGSNI